MEPRLAKSDRPDLVCAPFAQQVYPGLYGAIAKTTVFKLSLSQRIKIGILPSCLCSVQVTYLLGYLFLLSCFDSDLASFQDAGIFNGLEAC